MSQFRKMEQLQIELHDKKELQQNILLILLKIPCLEFKKGVNYWTVKWKKRKLGCWSWHRM